MSVKMTTGKVRFSYLNVFTPRPGYNGGDPEYSTTLLIPKKDRACVQQIQAAINTAKDEGIVEKWKGKTPKNLWNPLRDGDEERADEHPEYAGMYFLNCKSKQKPLVIDRDKDEILDQTEVYSGCWGRANISFFPFSTSGNNGVGCGLNAIQKLRDGEPLSGSRATAKDFDDGFEDDEEDPLG